MNINDIDKILNNIKFNIQNLTDSDLFLIYEKNLNYEDIKKFINDKNMENVYFEN